jgi:SsrA-binding protein
MTTLAYNRRAGFDYDVLEIFQAGIVLLGIEVKSVRAGQMSLRGAFVTWHDGQLILTNATIPPWQPSNTSDTYEHTRSRRLLLRQGEIKQLIGGTEQGLTIIPLRVYTKGPTIKVEIALARGKKRFSKKEAKKERDIRRDVDRMLRGKE